MTKTYNLIFVLLFGILLSACSGNSKDNIANSATQIKKPYVLLISIDGYRHDYTKLYRPPNILKLIQKGSQAKSLIPSFPTKTFPNHLTLVTGLYPENHGIVANTFYDPKLKLTYSLRDSDTVTDGRFYTGTPLWSLAEKQNMVTATYFWPGSEAEIAGERPSYYTKYDHGRAHEKRIDQIIEWLKLPEAKRPHFLTLYFSDVDSAGHNYGPNSLDTREAVMKVDNSLGRLFEELRNTNLPINIVIVSDHGMTETNPSGVSYLEDYFRTKEDIATFKKFQVVGKGPLVNFHYSGDEKDRKRDSYWLMSHLNSQARYFRAYVRDDIPAKFNFNKNPRIGDVLIIAKRSYSVGTKKSMRRPPEGNHGYSQLEGRDMHGIFYAQGPNIRPGQMVNSFKNIHVYPFIADILKLKMLTPIDGELRVLKRLVK